MNEATNFNQYEDVLDTFTTTNYCVYLKECVKRIDAKGINNALGYVEVHELDYRNIIIEYGINYILSTHPVTY